MIVSSVCQDIPLFLSVQIMQDNGWGRLDSTFCFSFLFYVLASVAPLGHKIEGGSRGHPMKHAAAKDGCLFSSQRTCISRTAFENLNYKKMNIRGCFNFFMLETRLSDWDGVEIGTSELRNYKRVQGGEISFNEEPFLIVRGQIRHRFPIFAANASSSE